jgi:hypothetical protein
MWMYKYTVGSHEEQYSTVFSILEMTGILTVLPECRRRYGTFFYRMLLVETSDEI